MIGKKVGAPIILALTLSACAPSLGPSYEKSFAAGQRAYNAGRLEEAVKSFEEAAQHATRVKDRDEAWLMVARMHEKRGAYPEAHEAYDRITKTSPDGPRAARAAYDAALVEVDHGDAKRGYELLLEAMEERNRVAIGAVVMRNKGRLAAIRPMGGLLAMSTMRYADEVVAREDIDELPEDRGEPQQRALDLALQVVDTMTAEWDPDKYPNTYTAELLEAIEARSDGVVAEPAEEGEADAPVIDLMAALRDSVDAAKKKAAERAAEG